MKEDKGKQENDHKKTHPWDNGYARPAFSTSCFCTTEVLGSVHWGAVLLSGSVCHSRQQGVNVLDNKR